MSVELLVIVFWYNDGITVNYSGPTQWSSSVNWLIPLLWSSCSLSVLTLLYIPQLHDYLPFHIPEEWTLLSNLFLMYNCLGSVGRIRRVRAGGHCTSPSRSFLVATLSQPISSSVARVWLSVALATPIFTRLFELVWTMLLKYQLLNLTKNY